MSILLESLNQSSKAGEQGVPNLADNHFDDEILSDEWQLKKVKFWKMVSFFLVTVLIVIVFFFYQVVTQLSDQSVLILNLQNQTMNVRALTDINSGEQQVPAEPVNDTDIKPESNMKVEKLEANTIGSVAATNQPEKTLKRKYTPAKVTVNNREQSVQTVSTPQVKSMDSIGSDMGAAITEFESLSVAEKQQMPELEISSYAVSSNSKKSFVVLNGAFYAQGEIIAPNLVLVSIEKESIVVQYYQQLIRKKYGL
ncbi:MAG: general secretion pathway protein GspB [Kangiellaceae bacterium]|nr:general secretion pathway protein GspB [Kangiellaceae bacterium]